MRTINSLRLALLLSALAITSAFATAIPWNNDAGGTFSEPTNWEGGVAPGATDQAVFTNNADYSIDMDASVTNSEARFNAPGGLADIVLGGFSWTLTNSL